MKIEKLPSGSYRIRNMYKGHTYQLVADYKPTHLSNHPLLKRAAYFQATTKRFQTPNGLEQPHFQKQ